MENIKLDKYETDILKSIENEEWQTISDFEKNKKEFKQFATKSLDNLLNINIQLSENDIIKLKERSKDIGIHYQSIISALIHNYVTKKINLKF